MKIIHCSDIHLDSAMDSNLSFQQAMQRKNELCSTFIRMVDWAKDNGVRLIMLAGDLFDSERISSKTSQLFFDAVEGAPDIDFLYLRGNHDESRRVYAGRVLPENLKTFSEDWEYYDYGNVRVSGIEFGPYNAGSLYEDIPIKKEALNIVLMHGQVSSQTGDELICLPKLKNRGIDYLALGHLHSYREERLDSGGVYCYCGCLEGRGFDECGEKGFVLLETGERHIEAKFMPFAGRRLYNVPTDITGLKTVPEIARAMKEASEDIPADSLVKFTLTGRVSPETTKDLGYLTASLKPSFFFVKVKDESRLELQGEDYINELSLKGEYIRMVLASEESGENKDKLILMGLRALSGEEISL